MDQPEKKGSADRGKINLSQEHEVRYWTEKFKVSPAQLQEAAREAGSSSVVKIEEALVSLGYLKHTMT